MTTAIIIVASMLAVSVWLVVYSVMPKNVEEREQVSRRLSGKSDMTSASAVKGSAVKTDSAAGKWFREKAAPVLSKPAMPKDESDQSNLRIKLSTAGVRGPNAPIVFLASKSAAGIACLALALIAVAGSTKPLAHVVGIATFAGGLGFMLPNVWLALAASQRKQKVTHGLPDTLDLMVVSVEAGLGLDAAMLRVSQEMNMVHPELAEDMSIANMEVQMGIARSEALKNMATRTGVNEVKSLTAILIQAEKFGTSIAQALRVHADAMRLKRRQEAEERAAKTAVKLIIPLILFIFPAIFVVLAGPAMFKLMKTIKQLAEG